MKVKREYSSIRTVHQYCQVTTRCRCEGVKYHNCGEKKENNMRCTSKSVSLQAKQELKSYSKLARHSKHILLIPRCIRNCTKQCTTRIIYTHIQTKCFLEKSAPITIMCQKYMFHRGCRTNFQLTYSSPLYIYFGSFFCVSFVVCVFYFSVFICVLFD